MVCEWVGEWGQTPLNDQQVCRAQVPDHHTCHTAPPNNRLLPTQSKHCMCLLTHMCRPPCWQRTLLCKGDGCVMGGVCCPGKAHVLHITQPNDPSCTAITIIICCFKSEAPLATTSAPDALHSAQAQAVLCLRAE